MSDNESKIIGFIAQRKNSIDLLCDGESAIVAGSEKKMESYIANVINGKESNYDIKKARYGHILQCLKIGAAYSFDEESYSRFYPLAILEGKKLVEFGKDANIVTGKTGLHLMRVKWI